MSSQSDYLVFGVTGKPRTGKTFLLNLLAHILYLDNGLKVQGNFPLFGAEGKGTYQGGKWSGVIHPNFREVQLLDLVEMLFAERCEPTEALFLHEVYAWFSSHKSLSDVNEFESNLVFQCGKLNRHIFYDAQLIMRVDGSLRKLASARYEAERDDENRQFIYWELDLQCPDKDLRTGNNFTIPFDFAAAYWNQYDTYSRTFPLGLAETLAKLERMSPPHLKKSIKKQVDLLLKEGADYGIESSSDCSTIAVKYALVQLEEPLAHADLVTVGLKLALRSSKTR